MVLGYLTSVGMMELFITRGQVVVFNSQRHDEKKYSHKLHSMGYLLTYLIWYSRIQGAGEFIGWGFRNE